MLFSNNDLSGYLRMKEISMLAEIDHYGEEEILNLSTDQLCDYCEKQYSSPTIVVRKDACDLKHAEADLQYSPEAGRRPVPLKGTIVAVDVPFEGPTALLVCIPSTQNTTPPQAEILNNYDDAGLLRFSYSLLPDEDTKILKAIIERDMNNLEFWVNNVNREVETFNDSLTKKARDYIEARKQRLLKARDQVAALNIPIARRADAPKTYTVPLVRKKITIKRPEPSGQRFKPEPTLAEAEYENILEIVSSMARVIECSPKVLSLLDEETLRTLFLVNLNAQYDRRATGETFNFLGKTDILIQAEDSGNSGHAFIAECKFWHGAKAFSDAIDQLSGYITWRDTKTAIIVFNKNKNFSKVLATVRETAMQHPNFEKEEESPRPTEYRFVFHRKDDSDRHFKLAVLVFEVPVPSDG